MGAFAQSTSGDAEITIRTDKTWYPFEWPVIISGIVNAEKLVPGEKLLLTIASPNGIEFLRTFINVHDDGTYSHQVSVPGTMPEGFYQVQASYNSLAVQTTFEIRQAYINGGPINYECYTAEGCRYVLSSGNQTFDIAYVMAGRVTNMSIDTEKHLISLELNVTEDFRLQIALPREVISAYDDDGEYVEFVVMTDGVKANSFDTLRNETMRVLAFDYVNGTKKVDIIGTSVIPEFGSTLLPFIGAAGIAAIILFMFMKVQTKRLRFRA